MSWKPAESAERVSKMGNYVDAGDDNETLVFEGETLAHSPRLARRFAGWVSRKFE